MIFRKKVSDLTQEDFDGQDMAFIVRLHFADRTDETSVITFLINTDEVECLARMKFSSLALGISEV